MINTRFDLGVATRQVFLMNTLISKGSKFFLFVINFSMAFLP